MSAKHHYGNGIWYEPTIFQRLRDLVFYLPDRRAEDRYYAELFDAERAADAAARPVPLALPDRQGIRILDWRLK